MHDTVGLDVLVTGLVGAVGRFRDVAYDETLTAAVTYVPLFEALSWADAIAAHPDLGTRSELLVAIDWARNPVRHEWSDALVAAPRAFGEGAYGAGAFGGFIWRWKARTDMTRRRKRRKDDDGPRLYDERLAGRAAIDTLEALVREVR